MSHVVGDGGEAAEAAGEVGERHAVGIASWRPQTFWRGDGVGF